MGDRYFVGVGSSKVWQSATNWSLVSGGAGGASIPTISDNAIFDANSPPCIVSSSLGSIACHNLDMTGYLYRVTSLSTSINITINGSLTLGDNSAENFPLALSGQINFTSSGSSTIKSNGKRLTQPIQLNFNGAGSWAIVDDFDCGAHSVNLQKGTLNTGGNNFLIGAFLRNGSLAASLILGGSAVLLLQGGWSINNATNFTLDAGTSSISTVANAQPFVGGGLTYHDVQLAGSALIQSIKGDNTFNNLILTGDGTIHKLSDNQAVNGLFATDSAGAQIVVQSDINGVQRTITAAAVSLQDAGFADIVAAGTSAPWSGSGLTDLGNNSNINF